MATIDKDLLKQIINAKQPRNYIFVEGSDDKVLVVNKAKISGDEQKAAEEKAKNGKVTSRGKVQVEQGEDGKKKVVFFAKKVEESLVPKLRRALKQQVGLSRVVEIRGLREDQEDHDDHNQQQPVNRPNRRGEIVPPVVGPLETSYRNLRENLLEEIEALKILKPKSVAKVEQALQEAERRIGPQQKGDGRFKESMQALKKLTENVTKLKLKAKPSKDQQAVSDRATYKNLRQMLAPRIYALADIDRVLAQDCINTMYSDADPLVDDKLPESKRNYTKGLKILEQIKKSLEKRELQAQKNGQQVPEPSSKSPLVMYPGLHREAKHKLAKFAECIPQAKELASLQQLLDSAAENYRSFQIDTAIDQLEQLTKQINTLQEQHDRILKALETTQAMLRQLQNLTGPTVSRKRVGVFASYLNGAMELIKKGQLDAALSGAKQLEEHMRQALSDRRLIVESGKMIGHYLEQAAKHKTNKDLKDYETRYLKVFETYDTQEFKVAYDEITKVESELANLVRTLPEEVTPSFSPEVKNSSRSPELLEGVTDKARQLKFKLNLEGVRRGFGLLKEKVPKTLTFFEIWLDKVLQLEKENFAGAEEELAELVKEMNLATALQRSALMKDYTPPRSRAPQRPVPRPPETTREWSQRIDRRKLKIDEKNMLGAGGQGSIYKVDSTEPNTPSLVMKVSAFKPNQNDVNELDEEAKNYEIVGDHPNIIKSLGMQTIGGKKGLVLEQVKGTGFDNVTGNLKARLNKGEISHAEFWSSIQYTLGKTLEVLDHMHSKGLTHNDIKPENIMIDETTGDVKVIDLGTVKKFTDNPEETTQNYRAPELPQGSTPQTDVFSTGASAYEMGEGEYFHFNDKGQRSTSAGRIAMDKILQKYSQQIGDVGEDELGIWQPSDQFPVNETVNEQGKFDPEGQQTKRNAGVAGSKTAYTEFMNWLLHPDPKKRPSAKEALQHPFLRDRLLTDEQVKGMLCKNMVDPPPEQVGKEPLRKIAGDGFSYAVDRSTRSILENAEKLVKTFQLTELTPTAMLGLRDKIDDILGRLEDAKRLIGGGIRAYESILSKAVINNSSGYFDDKQALQTMQLELQKWTSVESDLNECLKKVNYALTQQEPVSDDPNSDGITLDKLNERLRGLRIRCKEIATFADRDLHKATPLYEKLQSLRAYFNQVEGLQSRNQIEKDLLVKFIKANQGGSQQLAALEAAKEFKIYLQEVEKLREKIYLDSEDIRLEINGLTFDVDLLEKESQELFVSLDSAMQDAGEENLKFEALAIQPRNNQEAMQKFEDARVRFEQSQKILRELQNGATGTANELLRRTLQLSRQVGPQAPTDLDDLPSRLTRFEFELKRLMGDIK